MFCVSMGEIHAVQYRCAAACYYLPLSLNSCRWPLVVVLALFQSWTL